MWQPHLPNNGKVRVRISADITTEFFLDHYSTLNIAPVIEKESNKLYLYNMTVNGNGTVPVPKLYLDEYITDVKLNYNQIDEFEIFGSVVESYGDMSFVNYLPQLTTTNFNFNSFPRAFIYKGIKLGTISVPQEVLTYPVDLDKEDLEVWINGIKFTGRLNRDKKFSLDGFTFAYFDFIKAEFYGELLPVKQIDDYVELKPKGE